MGLAVIVVIRVVQRNREHARALLAVAVIARPDPVDAVVPVRVRIPRDQFQDALDRRAFLVARLLSQRIAPVVDRMVAVADVPAVVVAAGIADHGEREVEARLDLRALPGAEDQPDPAVRLVVVAGVAGVRLA